MASNEQLSLKWNEFHVNMTAGFHGLLSRGDLVDVTLAADGRLLQAHKLVLSVCSPYFEEMFKMNPTQHPIIFFKDVSYSTLKYLLTFMYQGEVKIKQEELFPFIRTAVQLQVTGLIGYQNEESYTPSIPNLTSSPTSSQQRKSVITKLQTDVDSESSSTPEAFKQSKRSSNNLSSLQEPAKRKCVVPLEAEPSSSAKENIITIMDEDDVEIIWDSDETYLDEDNSNMEMTNYDGSTTGNGNINGHKVGAGDEISDDDERNMSLYYPDDIDDEGIV